jgi:hypothetical protein
MALRGNLHDFNITQLFNLVNLARKTGLLTVENNSEACKVFFKEGKLIQAESDRDRPSLTSLLLKAGRISAEQVESVAQRARSQTDKELGLLLINSGYCSQRDIIQVVKNHIVENVYLLFTWTEGSFFFDSAVAPPDEQVTVMLSLENIIIEGTRRIKEWGQFRDDLPSLDVAIKFVDKPDARLRNVQLTADEWRVISFVSPKNSIQQIARACNMDEFQIRKIVYRLLQAGLVEVVRPRVEAPAQVEGSMPSGQEQVGRAPSAPKVDRGLLTRLIHKIRSIGE